VLQAVANTLEQNKKLEKELEKLLKEKALQISDDLFKAAQEVNGLRFIAEKVALDINQAKDLAGKLKNMGENVFVVLALENGDKVNLVVAFSDKLVEKGYHAGNTIRQIAQHIKGGGGGQPHIATAGGKDAGGIAAAFEAAKGII
jgi:alanyl-tRNA synthetase